MEGKNRIEQMERHTPFLDLRTQCLRNFNSSYNFKEILTFFLNLRFAFFFFFFEWGKVTVKLIVRIVRKTQREEQYDNTNAIQILKI